MQEQRQLGNIKHLKHLRAVAVVVVVVADLMLFLFNVHNSMKKRNFGNTIFRVGVI